jgi:NADPH2:quinone reductase
MRQEDFPESLERRLLPGNRQNTIACRLDIVCRFGRPCRFAADMDLAAKYGRIIVIGNRGEITISPRVAMMKELDIRGIALLNATAAQVKPIMRDILAGAAEGSLRPIAMGQIRP